VKLFSELASKKGVAPSQLVLAWVMSQGEDFFAIPGTRNLKYLEENLGASKVNITPEDNQEVRKIIKSFSIAGERYAPQQMKNLDQ